MTYTITIAIGIVTNLSDGNKYQRVKIEIVLIIEWNSPIQWSIIHVNGTHINPVKIPTVSGREV